MIETSALKTFPGWTREYIRKGISYVNLMYLLKTIPPYRGIGGIEDKGKQPKKVKGNNGKKIYNHFEQFNF